MIEAYSTKINQWVILVNEQMEDIFILGNGIINQHVCWNYDYDRDYNNLGGLDTVKISKLRFTINISNSFPKPNNTFCTIEKIFAFDGSSSALSKGGGDVYGDIEFKEGSIVIKDRSNSTKYRLKIDNGQIGLEAI